MQLDLPSASVRKLPSGTGLVLLDTGANCLWAYNDSARHVWELVERGEAGDTIVADFAERYAIPDPVARADVNSILCEWRSQGLVNGRQQFASEPTSNIATDWSRQPQPRWAAAFMFTIRGRIFDLSIEPEAIATFISGTFAHLAMPQARPDVSLAVRTTDDGETALIVDGKERTRTREGRQVMGAIDQAVLECLYPNIEWLALIHGGGVARDGRGFAIPGACGSGKTTLIAYLIANRGFTYVADDLIALSAPEGRIVPWPMPLGPKQGAWGLLSQWYPYLPDAPKYRTQLGEARRLAPSPDAWATKPAPVRGFIFPHYRADATPKLTRLTALEALQRLLGDRIWLGYPLDEQRVRAFLAWVEHVPAYSLVHGDVIEAARLIDQIT